MIRIIHIDDSLDDAGISMVNLQRINEKLQIEWQGDAVKK